MTQRVRTRTSGISRKKRATGDVFEVRFRDAEGVQRSRTFPTMDQTRAFRVRPTFAKPERRGCIGIPASDC